MGLPPLHGEGETVESPIGLLPAKGEINTDGLDVSEEAMEELLSVDSELFKQQLPQVASTSSASATSSPRG